MLSSADVACSSTGPMPFADELSTRSVSIISIQPSSQEVPFDGKAEHIGAGELLQAK